MKRKRKTKTSNSPPTKKQAVSELDKIISALGKKNKLNKNKFKFGNNFEKTSDVLSQTGNFVANQLSTLDNFKSVSNSQGYYSSGAYIPSQQTVELNLNILLNEEDAIKTLAHEGTHALDHLYMGMGSSVAIPFLARLEQKNNTNLFSPSINQNWYTQAQKILNDENFIASYGFKSSEDLLTKKADLNQSLQNLSKDLQGVFDNNPYNNLSIDNMNMLSELKTKMEELNELISENSEEYSEEISETDNIWLNQLNEIIDQAGIVKLQEEAENYGSSNLISEANKLGSNSQNFSDIYQNIKNIPKPQRLQNQTFHKPFTEFAAHIVENLDKPWNISNNSQDIAYWKKQDDGRKFLKAITKGVQNNFLELESEFANKYPDAHQAFNDRIFQLKREGKKDMKIGDNLTLDTPEGYFAYRQRRREEKLNPERHNHRLSQQNRPESVEQKIEEKHHQAESFSDTN